MWDRSKNERVSLHRGAGNPPQMTRHLCNRQQYVADGRCDHLVENDGPIATATTTDCGNSDEHHGEMRDLAGTSSSLVTILYENYSKCRSDILFQEIYLRKSLLGTKGLITFSKSGQKAAKNPPFDRFFLQLSFPSHFQFVF